jgi:hypothetical protein
MDMLSLSIQTPFGSMNIEQPISYLSTFFCMADLEEEEGINLALSHWMGMDVDEDVDVNLESKES